MSTPKIMPGFFASAARAASGTLVSRIFGLFRDVAMAALIPKWMTDIFFVAFRIPNMFRRLFGEGALTVSFVPVYQAIEADAGPTAAAAYFRRFHGLLIVVLIGLTVLGIVGAHWLIEIFTPGWRPYPEKIAQAAWVLRWCFPYLIFISLVACYMGVLNVHHRFWVPSVSPTLLNIAFLACIGAGWYFLGGDAAPWGAVLAGAVLLGGFSQWFVNIWAVKRLRVPIVPALGANPGTRRTFILMLPAIIALSALQLNIIVTTVFGSYLEEGTISALYYAARLVEFPLGVVAVSISTVLLPRIRHEAVSTGMYLNRAIFVLLPISVVTWTSPDVWVRLIFDHGLFDARMVELTTIALRFGALSILGAGLYRIFSAYAFSKEKPAIPAIISLAGAGLHVGLCALWVRTMGIGGISLSLGLVSLAQAAVMLAVPHSRVRDFDLGECVKILFASLVLGFHILMLKGAVANLHPLIQGGVIMLSGGVLYGLVLAMLRSGILADMVGRLRRRA